MIRTRLEVGETRSWEMFTDTDADGIADGWNSDEDFPLGMFKRKVVNGWQYQTIMPEAMNGGDVSIYRRFYAQPGDVYQASAISKLQNVDGTAFYGRLKLCEWDLDDPPLGYDKQGKEWFADNKEIGMPFAVYRVTTDPLRDRFDCVTIAFRAHAHQTADASGTAILKSLSLTRLA